MTARLLHLTRLSPGEAPSSQLAGIVAEAIVFSDGLAVLHWTAPPQGTEIYASEQEMREIRERSGGSVFSDVTPELAELPADLGFHLFVASDAHGVNAPDGSGDQITEAPSLTAALTYLMASALAGYEYVCLEVVKENIIPAGPDNVQVTGGKL